MGKGIKARACCNECWHTYRQFRIADHDGRQEFGMKDDLLLGRFRVGDDRSAAYL